MTPRAATRQIAELATEERDNALRRVANLEAEIQQLRAYAARMDKVTRVVGIHTPPVIASRSTLDGQPVELPRAFVAPPPDPIEIPTFAQEEV